MAYITEIYRNGNDTPITKFKHGVDCTKDEIVSRTARTLSKLDKGDEYYALIINEGTGSKDKVTKKGMVEKPVRRSSADGTLEFLEYLANIADKAIDECPDADYPPLIPPCGMIF